jgi:hydrogenase-4 component B
MNPLAIVVACAALLGLSAITSLLAGRRNHLALGTATTGCVLSCTLGLCASIYTLLNDYSGSFRMAWTLPLGEFHVAIDSLSAFFLCCVFLVSGVTSLYAAGYFKSHFGNEPIHANLSFYNMLVGSMVLLLVTRDAVLFIMAWEVMSIASFFLVTAEHEKSEVRRAGYLYLVASHLGTVFLLLLFALLSRRTGSFDFDIWGTSLHATAPIRNICFVLAVAGFGVKAGFWPIHIWLPYAHPAAPSPVSALMSGVMIKMGIYGILRSLQFLGPPPAWWGQLLIAFGIASGILGVLLALAQHDIKRLLAYSSVENVGIVAIGLGVGVLGQSQGQPTIAYFGFAGALLHVLNHALFKSLLFQAAGNVVLSTGQRNIQALGGLSRPMPVTSVLFLLGSVAICGLPPFNGFVSEWLIYVGAFRGSGWLATPLAASSVCALFALALIGGMAQACFARAFGVIFLGQPRSALARQAHEVRPIMLAPMVVLAGLCALIGIWPSAALRIVQPAASQMSGTMSTPHDSISMLGSLSRVALVLVSLVLFLALIRKCLLHRRVISTGNTWGCGHPAPTSRMQYSAASFAAPLLFMFRPLLGARIRQNGSPEYFPIQTQFEEHFSDIAGERVILPAADSIVRVAARLRVLQQGRVQLYLVYVFATLIVLLVWLLAFKGA